MIEYAITTKNLVKKFGRLMAVNNIDLNISKGSIHGFVGPNGAGKTTTIKMLIGAMLPTNGSGEVNHLSIGTKESRQVIGYAPEVSRFYKEMNAVEYLIYMGKLSGLTKEDAVKRSIEVLHQFELLSFMYQKPTNFSSGMKKKMIIAQSLMHNPSILILDEPTANLDPETRMFIIDILKKLVKEQHITVFISSHILTELELLVDEVTLIDKGKVVLTGKMDDIRNRFNQGILDIHTNDNEKLKIKLETMDYIDEIKVVNPYLKVYTKEVSRFKQDIVKILYELGLTINEFNEEKVTLDNIYKNVFGKNKEQEVAHNDNI